MKRVILLPLLPLLLTGALHAQTFNFGVKAGPQITSFTHSTDAKAALLYHAGIFANYSVMDRLQAQAELVFSASGANDTKKDYFKQRHIYLNLPLMAKYQMYDRLSVHTGLQLGLLMKAKLKVTEGKNEGDYDRKDWFNSFEVAYLLGAEYLITKQLSAGMRFNWSLTKLAKDYDKPRQNGIQFFAAYRLNAAAF